MVVRNGRWHRLVAAQATTPWRRSLAAAVEDADGVAFRGWTTDRHWLLRVMPDPAKQG